MNNEPGKSTGATPRRSFLKWLTALAGTAAAALVAIPGVGYIAGALKRPKPYPWVALGPVQQIPAA